MGHLLNLVNDKYHGARPRPRGVSSLLPLNLKPFLARNDGIVCAYEKLLRVDFRQSLTEHCALACLTRPNDNLHKRIVCFGDSIDDGFHIMPLKHSRTRILVVLSIFTHCTEYFYSVQ